MMMATSRGRGHAMGMHRFTLLFLAFASAHCGGTVGSPAGGPADTGAATDTGAPDTRVPVDVGLPETWTETAACTAVKASCTGAEAMTVLGHAEGLEGLEDARVEFAVRYISVEGSGLDVPHGVALGRTRVRAGAFATCVCVPHGANMYPQVAAVVYLPGTTSTTSKDVARASYSQRYATLGDEDFASTFSTLPSDVQKEVAVAAMVERTAKLAITKLTTVEGRQLVAGLVADERPLAPQMSFAGVEGGAASLHWNMPGKPSVTERVAFFIDQNDNHLCDVDADRGAIVPFTESIEFSGAWLTGAALAPVCDALKPGTSRE
jgi:hypothetical protein